MSYCSQQWLKAHTSGYDNIKMVLRDVNMESIDLIQLLQIRNRWRTPVNTTTNLGVFLELAGSATVF